MPKIKSIKKHWAVIGLSVLCLIFFLKFLINYNEIVFSPFSDIIEIESFWRYFSFESYKEYGQIPLWNPYAFSGATYIGNLSSRFFYFPFALFSIFNPDTLFGPLYIIHFIIAALSMYGLLRALKLDKFSSFAGSIIYTFSGTLVGYVYMGFPTMFIVIVAFPLSFLLLENSISKKKYYLLLLLSLLLALEFFGAHTQFFFYNLMFLGLYLLLRTINLVREENRPVKEIFRLWILFVLSIILAILLSAVQLFPSLEFVGYGTRSGGIDYDFVTTGSFPPKHIITILMPNIFGSLLNNSYWGNYNYFSLYIYFGILPILLVIISLLFNRNKYVAIFSAFAALSFILALGKHSPLFHLFYKFVPGFSLFRLPARMLFIFNFSLAVIVGFGVNYLSGKISLNNKKLLKRMLIILSAILVLSTLLLASLYFLKPKILSFGEAALKQKYLSSEIKLEPLEFYLSKVGNVFGEAIKSVVVFVSLLSLSIMIIAYRMSKKFNPGFFKIALIAIILSDLWFFGLPYINTKDPNEIFYEINIIKYLKTDESRYRIVDISNVNVLPQHVAIRHSVEKADGYDPMILGDYYRYMAALGNIPVKPSTTIPLNNFSYPKLLDLLNVKYIITNKVLKDDRYELVFYYDSYLYTFYARYFSFDAPINDGSYEYLGKEKIYLYKNKNSMPRAYIVPDAIVKNRGEIIGIIKNEGYNPKKHILIEKTINKPLENGAAYREINIPFYSPNKIALSADMIEPGFLFLSEIWYPGWKAFDNGKETEVYRANYIFRSVYLEKGSHNVEFVFDPASYRTGKWISMITLAGIAVYFLVICFKKAPLKG